MSAGPERPERAEDRLLVACARTALAHEQQEELVALVRRGVDWDALLAAAQRHALVPLVARHLRAAPGGELPGHVERFFHRHLEASARHNLTLTAELLRMLAALEAAGITAAPYKGPVLAAAVYGDIALREFSDLDVLVRQRDLPGAAAVLAGLGYRAEFSPALASANPRPAPGQYAFLHGTLGCLAELHTERTLRYFPVRADLEAVWTRLERVPLGGRAVRTLGAEDLLLFLCVHGAKDFWERLGWVCDVAELLRARPSLDWEALLVRSAALRARRILHLGLALARETLGAALPAEVERRVRRDGAALALAERVRGRWFRGAGAEPGALERLRFRVRLGEGLWQGLRYGARLAFSPTDEDRDLLPGPGGLAPLYAVLRPFRLLRKHGHSPRLAASAGRERSHASEPRG